MVLIGTKEEKELGLHRHFKIHLKLTLKLPLKFHAETPQIQHEFKASICVVSAK